MSEVGAVGSVVIFWERRTVFSGLVGVRAGCVCVSCVVCVSCGVWVCVCVVCQP